MAAVTRNMPVAVVTGEVRLEPPVTPVRERRPLIRIATAQGEPDSLEIDACLVTPLQVGLGGATPAIAALDRLGQLIGPVPPARRRLAPCGVTGSTSPPPVDEATPGGPAAAPPRRGRSPKESREVSFGAGHPS